MGKKNSRTSHANPVTQPVGVSYTFATPDGAKVTMSDSQFIDVFRQTIAGIPTPELGPDPATFKGNPVTPGVGSRVIGADRWFKRYKDSAVDAATEWEERTLQPRRDPIAAAIANDDKRKNRLAETERMGKWLKKMRSLTFNNVAEGVLAVGPGGYSDNVTRKAPKAERAIKALQPKVEALAKALDAMPTGTKEERGRKMLAARDGMLAIGGETGSSTAS